MAKTIAASVLLIAFTDVALQLDNALAISSVAAGVPPAYRFAVLAGGVLLAALCLFVFTLVGSSLIEHLAWLRPVAGIALVMIGIKLALEFFRS